MAANVVPLISRPRAASDGDAPVPRIRADLDSLPLLLAVPVAARLLGISRSGAYRLAEAGELPVKRLGGRVYVVTSKLLDLMEAA